MFKTLASFVLGILFSIATIILAALGASIAFDLDKKPTTPNQRVGKNPFE